MHSSGIPSYEQAFSKRFVRYEVPKDNARGGIQIPRRRLPGVVYLYNPKANPNLGHYLYQDIVRAAGNNIHLQGLLRHIGVTILWDKATKEGYCKYPHGKSIVKKVAEINKSVPPEHRLPNFKVVRGGDLPAEKLLRNIAHKNAFSLATGRGDSSTLPPIRQYSCPRPQAYYSAHDMIVHFPTMLTTERNAFGLMRISAQRGLDADQTPNCNGITAAGLAMRALDKTLTSGPEGMGHTAVDLQPHPEFFRQAFVLDVGTADRLADLSMAHIAYLIEQFPA